ncbi:unnamed protein product [Knipowitschia caucasica]|uniref:Ig-like domain-containing protein n=1 Tax=Knipowitschia caucasica TaxID=637954 RepID=A0AAV2K7N0_KNICA
MESIERAWVLLLLFVAAPAASSSLPSGSSSFSSPSVVVALVGSEALLPCSWLQPGPHVQWSSESSGPVLEQRGSERWSSPDLSERVLVPESGLQTGDCSLLISDVQVTDAGQYNAYVIQERDQSRTRDQTEARTEARTEIRTGSRTDNGVFICSVKLLVFDHSLVESKRPGEDLLLDLFSPHSMSLVFHGSNFSSWHMLWRRGALVSPRVQKVPLKQQLRLLSVTEADRGVYKVLDQNGLTVSSTRLSVQRDPMVLRSTHETDVRGRALGMLPSALLLTCSLLTSSLLTSSSSDSKVVIYKNSNSN